MIKKQPTILKGSLLTAAVIFPMLLAGMIFAGTANAQTDYTPIYDIQNTTDPSGDSPYKDQADVTTEGIVTAFFSNSYFIEDPAGGSWNGLFEKKAVTIPSVVTSAWSL